MKVAPVESYFETIHFHQTCLGQGSRRCREFKTNLQSRKSFVKLQRRSEILVLIEHPQTKGCYSPSQGVRRISYSPDSGETSNFKTEQRVETKSLSAQRFSHLKNSFQNDILTNFSENTGSNSNTLKKFQNFI